MVSRIDLLLEADVHQLLNHLPAIKYYYIKASKDCLVPQVSAATFKRALPTIEIVTIEGGHFIVQANPIDCWAVIEPSLRIMALGEE